MERNQDIITFTTEDGDEAKFHVIEETRINGRDYLLVLDDIEDEEQEALILKDVSAVCEKQWRETCQQHVFRWKPLGSCRKA